MPSLIKRSAPHVLISMFVAPLVLAIFMWFGKDIMGNHDVKVQLPHITKQLDSLVHSMKDMESKADAMLVYIGENRLAIKLNENEVNSCEDDYINCMKQIEKHESKPRKKAH